MIKRDNARHQKKIFLFINILFRKGREETSGGERDHPLSLRRLGPGDDPRQEGRRSWRQKGAAGGGRTAQATVIHSHRPGKYNPTVFTSV